MRIEFPKLFHFRVTVDMLDEIKGRGGAHWLRSLIAANTRPPADATPPRGSRKRVRRVTLDKRKPRTVKHRESREA